MDTEKFPQLISDLYCIVEELEKMFDRHFTPDGHMVGSLGEALAAYHYGLDLMPASNKGSDAVKDGKRIEIKATQGNRVAFRSEPEYVLVLKLNKDGTFEEVYNGSGNRIWQTVCHKPKPSNGQYQVSLSSLEKLSKEVASGEKVENITN